MKYSIKITVVCFIGFSVSSSWKLGDRNGRNLSFSNILKNYLTKYPTFKETPNEGKPLENRQNRREFPYKIVKPSPLNHQKTPKSHFSKYYSEHNQFEQNPHDKNFNFMQNRGAAFIQNFRERSNIPNIFDKFSNNVGSTDFPPKSMFSNVPTNMVRNSDLQSKSKPVVKIPKQMPGVSRNEEIKESAWISWSPKPSSPSPTPPLPPQQKKYIGFNLGQDDYKVV